MRKIITGALALAAALGCLSLTVETASARHGRNGAFVGGAAVGAVGGLLLGGALQQRRPYDDQQYEYDQQPVYAQPRCHLERRRVSNDDGYGSHVVRVRVCDRSGY